MITINKLKDTLKTIGFKNNDDEVFVKKYPQFNQAELKVDINSKQIFYPEDKGLKVWDKTSSGNFDHPENFVVLECVTRLMDKGYRPEHIEIEPKWTLGHDSKGGKADILVKDDEGKSLLIIECKTSGSEFNKEKKNTEEYGGQLFSYWQQENATRWIALYSSDWNEKELSYKCLVINCTDDANIIKMAENDNDVKVYSKARNDKERFEVWDETYHKEWLDDVVFNEESQAYNIGIPPLRKGKLKDFTPDDHIVNRFEEILRHNNVSDKENAFNRLVALFICKLVDEIKKQDFDVVDFQYKQGQDTYESLQDRLQHLHQQGMEEFMKEKILYVEADYAERLFKQYTGRQRKAAIEDLNRTIRILKFYSNNDFAFKDVHNEELFYQNGKILVEVVQLFQPYRIVYPSKHQFLGDLFEQLLNKGFKQNEGQFFTPTPITRFIWDSLPLQNYIFEHDLPRVIDYACGAGHFLTEAVEAINTVRPEGDNSWVDSHIYGVEKDYRLARVSKISMFMNGAGGSNIIFGDGLENYPEKGITPASFDILVANPPYAVKGFKQHLKLKNNTFSIVDKVSPDGDEIEMLFVERIAQLLKPKGIAAVILPSSILNDTSSSGIAARENLLQNFLIHAIVTFGSQTFGATGTNTVTLFLERYNEPPRFAELAKDTVEGILSHGGDVDWEDMSVLDAYISHQNTDKKTYIAFLRQTLTKEQVSADSYLKGYVDAFQLDGIKYPNRCTEKAKAQIRQKKFYDWAVSIEKKKLYYFSLVYQQKTLVVTAPSDNKEQKDFLGYEWSNRKGQEGIKIKKPGGKLYNADDRFAGETLASAVRNSFIGTTTIISDDLIRCMQTYDAKNIIDFSSTDFKIIIKASITNNVNLNSKHPIIQLAEVVDINQNEIDPTLSPNKEFTYVDIASIENGTGIMSLEQKILGKDAPSRARRIAAKECTIVSTVRPNLKAFAYIDKNLNDTVFSTGFAILSPKDKSVLLPKLVYYFFMNLDSLMEQILAKMPKGQYPSVNKTDIESLKIPLPPLDIQKEIIDQCDKIDEEYNASRMTIEVSRKKLAEVYKSLDVISRTEKGNFVKINQLLQKIVGHQTKIAQNEIMKEGKYPVISQEADSYISGYTNNENVITDLPLIVFGDHSCTFKYVDYPFIRGADGTQLMKFDQNVVLPKYMYFILKNTEVPNAGKYERHYKYLKNMDVFIPEIKEQKKIIKQLETLEKKIDEEKMKMSTCLARKRDLLNKYLS